MSAIDLSLRGQAEAIAAGDADPSELLDEALARIEERNPALNAIVETFPERSREMLAAAPDGPLRGVPVVIKDEWPLPWRAQRFGSAELPAPTAPAESGPYRALRDAGAVIVGVGNMEELGAGSTGAISVYGPAHNPWDPDRCPGGSSSGPAASVAARLVAGAVGADGLGSVRYPAAYCGLTGLKPTFARSAMEGHHAADDDDHDRLRPALRRRRRLPAAGLGALRRGACRGRRLRSADRRHPRRPLRGRRPRGRRRLRGGDRDAARGDRRHDPGGRAARSRRGDDRGGPDRQQRRPRRGDAGAAQPPRPRDQPDQPRRPQVPDADPGGRRLPGAPGPHPDPPPAGRPLRGRRRARLADRPGAGAAARGADRRAPLGHRDRRPGQRPRRRPREPDRHPGDQRPGRAQLRGPADRPPARAAWGRDELLLDAAEALERANGRRWVDARPPLAETEPAAADGS